MHFLHVRSQPAGRDAQKKNGKFDANDDRIEQEKTQCTIRQTQSLDSVSHFYPCICTKKWDKKLHVSAASGSQHFRANMAAVVRTVNNYVFAMAVCECDVFAGTLCEVPFENFNIIRLEESMFCVCVCAMGNCSLECFVWFCC